MMRAFLSHSSVNKPVVEAVHSALGRDAVWLDRAEIEWGDVFLERLEAAIQECSDFVLFWSADARDSEWVRLELNLYFVQKLKERAIRLRVIRLDKTPLRALLNLYQVIDASETADQAGYITAELRRILSQQVTGVRNRFLNRSRELESIESAIDDPACSAVLLYGLQGGGKRALVSEAITRFFPGAVPVKIEVGRGTDLVELSLLLSSATARPAPSVNTSRSDLELHVAACIEQIAREGQFLVVENIQHWVDDFGGPNSLLERLLAVIDAVPAFRRRPVFMTSTRNLRLPMQFRGPTRSFYLDRLTDEHVSTLLALHCELSGREITRMEAEQVAPQLFGHPLAAKFAAALVVQYGAAFLAAYPRELVNLRSDVTKALLQELPLTDPSLNLLETLAIAGTSLPARVLAAGSRLNDNDFQDAVAAITSSGLTEPSGDGLVIHPFVADHFWRQRLHREGYQQQALALAEALHGHIASLPPGSDDIPRLLPVVMRTFAIAGRIDDALRIRADLFGELLEAAFFHYNRRDYRLAVQFVDLVLGHEPTSWRARVLKVRLLIRTEEFDEAHRMIDELRLEKPDDTTIDHVNGWMLLRRRSYLEAIPWFLKVLSRKQDHVQSLRDLAECLYRLGRHDEALIHLQSASQIESHNPFIFSLKSRILENQGKLPEALIAAQLAEIRGQADWELYHRLGRISQQLNQKQQAIDYYRKSIDLDGHQFAPHSSLASCLLDVGDIQNAQKEIDHASKCATNARERGVIPNLRARTMRHQGQITEAIALLETEVSRGHSDPMNIGLLCDMLIDTFEKDRLIFPSSATIALNRADSLLKFCIKEHGENDFLTDVAARLRQVMP